MSGKGTFNALAAVRMMAVDDDDEDPPEENTDLNVIAKFLDVKVDISSKPLKSILKRRDDSNLKSDLTYEGVKNHGNDEDANTDIHQTPSVSAASSLNVEYDSSILTEPKDSSSRKQVDSNAASIRIIMKISGLPYKFKPNELLRMFGVWPRSGPEGIKHICDTAGDPTGCAYIELDRHIDKMALLKLSGIKFKNKTITVAMSSVGAMNLDWISTQRITQQIAKSPFVRISNLPYQMKRSDIFQVLANYKRQSEDIYSAPGKPGSNNEGFCYVIMDSKEDADQLCSETICFQKWKLFAKKVHPEVVSRWCRRQKVKFIVRDNIKCDMTVDVEVPKLDGVAEEDITRLKKTCLTAVNPVSSRRNVQPIPVEAQQINADPTSSVFFYDEDHPELTVPIEPKPQEIKVVKENAMKNKQPQTKQVKSSTDDESEKAAVLKKTKEDLEKATTVYNLSDSIVYVLDYNAEMDHQKSSGKVVNEAKVKAPARKQERLLMKSQMIGPNSAPHGPFNAGPPRLFPPRPVEPFPVPRGMGLPGPFQPGFMQFGPGPIRSLPGPHPINGPPRLMPALPSMSGPPQPMPGPFGPHPPMIGPPAQPGISPFFRPMGVSRPQGLMPTIYVRVYNVPDKATTDDIKKFFTPVLPAKIAQNLGYDIYDVDFYHPGDAMEAMRKNGAFLLDCPLRLEMLPGPPVPLPPKSDRKRKCTPPPAATLPFNVSQPAPMPRPPSKLIKGLEEAVTDVKQQKRSEVAILVPPFPDDPLQYRLPPYNAETPQGQCAIQPMEGYFCKLCRKFYKHKAAGVISHCRSKLHYDNLKQHIEAIKAKRAVQRVPEVATEELYYKSKPCHFVTHCNR